VRLFECAGLRQEGECEHDEKPDDDTRGACGDVLGPALAPFNQSRIGERERDGCRRAIGWKRATGPDIMIKQNIPNILVIEKDGQDKRLLQVALKASGFNVLLANTGSEAIAQSKLNTPALIILDIDNVEGILLRSWISSTVVVNPP